MPTTKRSTELPPTGIPPWLVILIMAAWTCIVTLIGFHLFL